MFWKKKIPEARKDKLTMVEEFIVQAIVKQLSPEFKIKLEGQIPYLQLMTRITYKNDTAVELYPLQFDDIPENILFPRKEEFKLATLVLGVKETKARCEVFMVLGALFEIRIKPHLPQQIIQADELILKSIIVEMNLDKNTY